MQRLSYIHRTLIFIYSITFVFGGQAEAAKNSQVSSASINVSHGPYPYMLHPVRIGITRRSSSVRFAVWKPGALFIDGRPVFKIEPARPYLLTGGSIIELGTNRSFHLPTDRRPVIAASDYRIWISNRWYRGSMEIISFGGSITAIDVLDLEEYLLGVVPSEMPSNWHPEALKAQAVAARSYAWAHTGRGSKWLTEGFDLVPDVRDQAYKGLAAEANSTYWAVRLTQGIILKDSNRVKPGFYRAWVGDAFENLNIRKEMVPESMLEKITGVPKIVGVTVKQWDASGNARDIQVIGQKKSREVYGIALAKMLRLQTAGILDVQSSGSNWIFTYRGPGNGARGLSQHGANMLAMRGWRYDQILQQYYQDPDGRLRLESIDGYRQQQTASYGSNEANKSKASKSTSASTSTPTLAKPNATKSTSTSSSSEIELKPEEAKSNGHADKTEPAIDD